MTFKELIPLATGIVTLTAAMAAGAELANPDFADFDPLAPGTVAYAENEGPPGWFLTAGSGQVITDSERALESDSVFRFDALTSGYGANKLEQCILIDEDHTISISFAVFAPFSNPAGLAVRVNPTFYDSLAACDEAMRLDSGGGRLTGGRDNADIDYVLGAEDGNTWIVRSPSSTADLLYAANQIPVGARFMRLSLRNRVNAPANSATDPHLLIDAVRVSQGSDTTSLAVNGAFDHVSLFDGDFVAGNSGWVVNRGEGSQARAAVGPVDFALSGNNVIYLENLSGNFGINRLDQCFPVGDADIQPSVSVYTVSPDPELSVRLNTGFFASEDCSGSALSDLGIQTDFALDGPAREWQTLVADSIRSTDDIVGAQSALYSIRLRDRSGEGDNPDVFQKIVFLDEASAIAGLTRPTFSPAPGTFDTETLDVTVTAPEGAMLLITTDGSEPDMSLSPLASPQILTLDQTTTVRTRSILDDEMSAVRSGSWTKVDPPPPPLRPTTNTGCTLSQTPGTPDPLLPVLVLMALAWIAWRRRVS
jgi:hypothetical protein